MKQITLNIPDSKYPFFMELIKNLGLKKVKMKPSENTFESKNPKTTANRVSSLLGKLHLSKEQYNDFHRYVNNSREEWNRSI